MYDRKETTQEAAARLGLPELFTAMHEGDHKCVDGRRYVASCLITDPDCDSMARGYMNLPRAPYVVTECVCGQLGRGCEACGAEPGERCRPMCIGEAAALDAAGADLTADDVPECPNGHGPMALRPLSKQSPEQIWCGTWYDCPPGAAAYHCSASALVPSAELAAQNAQVA
jgi:hypothetical protein